MSRPNSRQSRAKRLRQENQGLSASPFKSRTYWVKKSSPPEKKIKTEGLLKQPYFGTNNRKLTSGRMSHIENINCVQSVPMFKKDRKGNRIAFLGFKIVTHKDPIKQPILA